MSKHTPGPWEVVFIEKRKRVYYATIVAEPSKLHLATLFSLHIDELKANANLIAAAPDLEDALWAMAGAAKLLQALHNDSESDDVDEAHNQYAKAELMFMKAIKKVKGE
jgi:hypothetical protein